MSLRRIFSTSVFKAGPHGTMWLLRSLGGFCSCSKQFRVSKEGGYTRQSAPALRLSWGPLHGTIGWGSILPLPSPIAYADILRHASVVPFPVSLCGKLPSCEHASSIASCWDPRTRLRCPSCRARLKRSPVRTFQPSGQMCPPRLIPLLPGLQHLSPQSRLALAAPSRAPNFTDRAPAMT